MAMTAMSLIMNPNYVFTSGQSIRKRNHAKPWVGVWRLMGGFGPLVLVGFKPEPSCAQAAVRSIIAENA